MTSTTLTPEELFKIRELINSSAGSSTSQLSISLTNILVGLLIFLVGQTALRLVIEPLFDLRRKIALVKFTMQKVKNNFEHLLGDQKSISFDDIEVGSFYDDNQKKMIQATKSEMIELSSELSISIDLVIWRRFFQMVSLLPHPNNYKYSCTLLIELAEEIDEARNPKEIIDSIKDGIEALDQLSETRFQIIYSIKHTIIDLFKKDH